MNKQEIEKSLKRYLKKKVSYSLSLLITFLITGGFAYANELNQEEMLVRIKDQRAKIEKLLEENYKKEAALQKGNLELLKEADFYTKPGSAGLFSMAFFSKNVSSQPKEWKGTVREETEHDQMRRNYNDVATYSGSQRSGLANNKTTTTNTLLKGIDHTKKVSKLSSGWINKSTNYGQAANAYDVEAKLFILPVVKAPVVNTPIAPVVNFVAPKAPTELSISAPSLINVNIGAITVNAPVVNVPTVSAPSAITAPTMQEVRVNEPNINVSIGAINVANPTIATPPSLTAPTVSVNVAPAAPPSIEVPNPTVTAPNAPAAPNFTAFSRGRGNWLGGFSFISGRMDWTPGLEAWEIGIGFATPINMDSQPIFNGAATYLGQGKTSGSVINAYTKPDGTVVNSYSNIKSDTNLSGGTPNNSAGIYPLTRTSPVSIPGMTAGTYYSATDARAGRTQQSWVFQGSPVVKDMQIKIGGGNYNDPNDTNLNTPSTALFAQISRIKLENVALELAGKAIVGQLNQDSPMEVTFTNTDINITGNYNTLITTNLIVSGLHGYWGASDLRGRTDWGAARSDTAASSTAVDFGGTNLTAATKRNALYYVQRPNSQRWFGSPMMVPVPGTTTPAYSINSESYHVYPPAFGNVSVKNTGGTVKYIGAGNVGTWVSAYVPDRTKWVGTALSPYLNLGKVYMQGDNNVAYYFAKNTAAPNGNGIFQGEVVVDAEIGTDLDGAGGNTQVALGNISGGDASKSENNVAVYLDSGQRKELNNELGGTGNVIYKQYFPATLDFTVDTVAHPGIVGIANGSQIGYPILSNDPIKDLKITNFNVKFGQYSKKGIGIVAKNGSVVEINKGGGQTINDGASGTNRATESVMIFAEGVFYNPRKVLTGGTYNKEAYGRGESTTGQKSISDFNTTVNIKNDVEMGSINSTAFFAKRGAIIDATNNTVKMTGHTATAVLAHATEDHKASTIVDSNNANAGKQPKTEIIVKSVEALAHAAGTEDKDKNTNIAVAAISEEKIGSTVKKGTGDVTVTVKEDVKVDGLGAFASGEKATVNIESKTNTSAIKSGSNGALVATNAGTINFGGGTITHNVDDKVAFYAEKKKVSGNDVISHINFKGATTLNISKGIVFYGDKEDYSKTATVGSKETGRYTGMGNVTVNLQGHGVNLGVFKSAELTWKGNASTAYTDDIAQIPKVAAINTGIYWYKTTLESGTLKVKADVNRDSISVGTTRGDGFNDIRMEREKVILEDGKTISSTKNNGMLLASNGDAKSNTESGYTVKEGKISISNKDASDKATRATVATYVNFGHIITEKNGSKEGTIEANNGVAVYGVNGSKISNSGTVSVGSSSKTQPAIAIMALARTEPYQYKDKHGKTVTKVDDYGIFAGKASAGANWIEIINKGKITVTGTDAIGIYAKNNYNNTIAKNKILIHNEGVISLGDRGKGIVIQTKDKSVTNGGTLTLKDSKLTANNQDIKVGDEGIGIYTEYSDIKFDGNYGIAIGNKGVAIQTKGINKIEQTNKTDTLNIEYKSSSTAKDTSAMAIGYTGTTKTDVFTNKLNLNLVNTDKAVTFTGIYANGLGKLVNQGDITSASNGSYGIISNDVEVENKGTIKVGATTSNDSNAVGIYVKNAKLTTDGDKIVLQGNGNNTKSPLGIYAKADSSIGTTVKDITINQGTNPLSISSKKAVGIYIEDGSTGNNKLKLVNNSNITLSNSASKTTERKIGLILRNSKNSANVTNGKITVAKNNLGIFNNNSTLTHTGILEVKHNGAGTENIGIHNTGTDFKLTVTKDILNPTRLGKVDVEGQNGTIGISAITGTTGSGEINLVNATVNVNAPDKNAGKIPLGLYADGNKISVIASGTTKFTVSPNAVGIYMKGNNTSKVTGVYDFSLSSENTKNTMGIGAFLTGGAYVTTGTSKLKLASTATATNANGAIRPIGLFYGAGSTKNEANLDILASSKEVIGLYANNLSAFENKGTIEVKAKSSMGAYVAKSNITNKAITTVSGEKSYGWYLKGGNSSTTAKILALAKESVGVLISGKGITGVTSFENKSGVEILANADKSIGVYAEEGAKYKNKGILNSLNATSIGAFGVKATLVNDTNATINAKKVALYAKTSSTIENKGTINVTNKGQTGIIADDKTTINLTAGKIESNLDKVTAVVVQNKSTVNLKGTNIKLGKNSIAINSTKNSTVNLTSGNVEVGEKGLGIFTKDGKVDLKSYTGKFTLGKEGIAIYSKNSVVNGGTLKVDYSNNAMGVGIYYDGGTVNNNTVVSHTGKKLVNIFSSSSNLTNIANQKVQAESIGIYANGGTLANKSTITLEGDKSVGFFLDNKSKLTEIGTINGATAPTFKIGVYVNKGSIEGSKDYTFGVNNGVAMYLGKDGVNNSTGTLNLNGNSVGTGRTIGIYTTPTTTTRNINTSIKMTGKDAVGLFLSNGSKVSYGGTLDITSNSSNTNFGIGASVEKNSTFTLNSAGKVKIGGTNNIGFFVKQGGTLQVSGGTVQNTKDGIFAYLSDGQLNFTAGTTPNINFLNVFVSGNKGSIQNATAITVGTAGMQASQGAKILNNTTGVINGRVQGAKALIATSAGSKVENKGAIKLTADKSVAIYADNRATGISTGKVEIGKNSVAYYTNRDGIVNVSGNTKIGEASTIFYVNSGQVNYTGPDIVLPNKTTAITLTAISPSTKINFNNKSIAVGESGTGIYVSGQGEVTTTNIQNLAKISTKKSANAIYLNNNRAFSSKIAIDLVGENSIGVLSTKNGNINYSGNLNSTIKNVKGIVHKGSGNTINSGVIKVTGNSSIGIYAENGGILENRNKIEIGQGTKTATSVGLYGKNQTTIINKGNIKMVKNSIGIYGKHTIVKNLGTIQNSGLNNNAIYVEDSDIINSGNISLGDSSNGIYATSTTAKSIINSGNIKVGNNQAAAIFGDGRVGINNTSGTITVGKQSVGLATKQGNISVGSATKFNVGEESTYIYTEKGSAVNNATLNVSKYSVAMYTKEGSMQNKGNIKVGESSVGNKKISVAMATEKGIIENFGNITIPNSHGVAMVANKGGTAINRNGGTISVGGEAAYGLQATGSSVLINEGRIDVAGKDARGIAATNKSKVTNTATGIINVNGVNAQGIYVDYGSRVKNDGTININSSTGVGLITGSGGTIDNSSTGKININVAGGKDTKVNSGQLSAGAITIKGPKAYIGNVEIQNSGTITVNGALNFNQIRIGSTVGNIGTINATSFEKGKFIVLPNAALGSNKDMYTVQYLGGIENVPNNGSITAISHSATFVADIQKDDTNLSLARVMLVRIPYAKLLAETPAEEFGKGLDDLYKGLSKKGAVSPKNPTSTPYSKELDMFDALKTISDKEELGATFDMELRGNAYANVQRRMLDINETFSTSYENLKNSTLYAKGRFKTGAIVSTGNAKDKNPGVEDYKTKTTGAIVMKEKDFKTYGRSADVSLAFTETEFKFDYGSKEKVHSLQLGAGYEDFLTEHNWKYSTRGEVTLNRHNMKRKMHLSNGTYENKGKYWSKTVEWKNKLRYEGTTANGLITAGIFGTFNLGYGKFDKIKENGDGAELEVKSKDMYMVRPGVGTDLSLNYYTNSGKVSVIGTATAEYEAGKVYDGVNQVRIKNSTAGYYGLEKPKAVKEVFKVGAQVQYETNAGHKIGVGVTREEGSVRATKYGVNAAYKF